MGSDQCALSRSTAVWQYWHVSSRGHPWEIPKTRYESTDDIIMNLVKHLDIHIQEKDIDISHRTSSNDEAAIIVKFDSRTARNKFYEGRKRMKDRPATSLDLGFREKNLYTSMKA